jgi:hypothetical protein
MSSASDLVASVSCPDNHDVYRRMVELEITSAFSFQSGKWLGDVAPHLLTADQAARLQKAKQTAQLRTEIEAKIPKHLIFTKGFPASLPTYEEAQLLADIRTQVAKLQGLEIGCTTAESVIERYASLLALKAIKEASKRKAKPDQENESEHAVNEEESEFAHG